jgi:hypothetical protein
MSDEQQLENKLKELSVAPRIALSDVEAAIKNCYFFTAKQGVDGSPTQDVQAGDATALGLFTICVITLKNGFVVTGESACASPENYNKEIGEEIAKRNATSKIWGHMGFALRDRLHREQEMLAAVLVPPSEGMSTYIGTKVVNAKPMNRADYNTLRGWELPANEDGADEGYLVEYTDKLDGQVEGFAGYVSWSPADVFERAYTGKGGYDWKDRVRTEYAQLKDRLDKLEDAFAKGAFKELDDESVSLLVQQKQHMIAYKNILEHRISRF